MLVQSGATVGSFRIPKSVGRRCFQTLYQVPFPWHHRKSPLGPLGFSPTGSRPVTQNRYTHAPRTLWRDAFLPDPNSLSSDSLLSSHK